MNAHMNPATQPVARPPRWQILLAFGIIYFVWGSTFYAIRVGVREAPPLLLAGMRFFAAGLVLYSWLRLRGTPAPSRREWANASLLGAIIFLLDYGCLFWAEQRVPSGIAAVMLASIPVFVTLMEIIILRTQRLTVRLSAALVIGVCGVAVLMNRSFSMGEVPLNRVAAIAILLGAFSWSLATILTRKLRLPEAKAMSSAAQMLSGGVQLFIAAALFGEFSEFHPRAISWNAWFALLYLIVMGSIVGFTAYVWLLHHESPTKVGTYAYVNPLVAVALGYFLGGEEIGRRTLVGMLLILTSVVAITTMRKPEAKPARQIDNESAAKLSQAEAD